MPFIPRAFNHPRIQEFIQQYYFLFDPAQAEKIAAELNAAKRNNDPKVKQARDRLVQQKDDALKTLEKYLEKLNEDDYEEVLTLSYKLRMPLESSAAPAEVVDYAALFVRLKEERYKKERRVNELLRKIIKEKEYDHAKGLINKYINYRIDLEERESSNYVPPIQVPPFLFCQKSHMENYAKVDETFLSAEQLTNKIAQQFFLTGELKNLLACYLGAPTSLAQLQPQDIPKLSIACAGLLIIKLETLLVNPLTFRPAAIPQAMATSASSSPSLTGRVMLGSVKSSAAARTQVANAGRIRPISGPTLSAHHPHNTSRSSTGSIFSATSATAFSAIADTEPELTIELEQVYKYGNINPAISVLSAIGDNIKQNIRYNLGVGEQTVVCQTLKEVVEKNYQVIFYTDSGDAELALAHINELLKSSELVNSPLLHNIHLVVNPIARSLLQYEMPAAWSRYKLDDAQLIGFAMMSLPPESFREIPKLPITFYYKDVETLSLRSLLFNMSLPSESQAYSLRVYTIPNTAELQLSAHIERTDLAFDCQHEWKPQNFSMPISREKDESLHKAAIILQKVVRGFLARKKISQKTPLVTVDDYFGSAPSVVLTTTQQQATSQVNSTSIGSSAASSCGSETTNRKSKAVVQTSVRVPTILRDIIIQQEIFDKVMLLHPCLQPKLTTLDKLFSTLVGVPAKKPVLSVDPLMLGGMGGTAGSQTSAAVSVSGDQVLRKFEALKVSWTVNQRELLNPYLGEPLLPSAADKVIKPKDSFSKIVIWAFEFESFFKTPLLNNTDSALFEDIKFPLWITLELSNEQLDTFLDKNITAVAAYVLTNDRMLYVDKSRTALSDSGIKSKYYVQSFAITEKERAALTKILKINFPLSSPSNRLLQVADRHSLETLFGHKPNILLNNLYFGAARALKDLLQKSVNANNVPQRVAIICAHWDVELVQAYLNAMVPEIPNAASHCIIVTNPSVDIGLYNPENMRNQIQLIYNSLWRQKNWLTRICLVHSKQEYLADFIKSFRIRIPDHELQFPARGEGVPIISEVFTAPITISPEGNWSMARPSAPEKIKYFPVETYKLGLFGGWRQR